MKSSALLLLAVFAFGSIGCEQHPLPGQPPIVEAKPHAEEAKPAATEGHAAEKPAH